MRYTQDVFDINHKANRQLLDININFDGHYPTIVYTYLDKKERLEVKEEFQAYAFNETQASHNLEATLTECRRYMDKSFEIRDMTHIRTTYNKL